MTRPAHGVPPGWHTMLDYVGLFLQYFAGVLAVLVVGVRVLSSFAARRGTRDAIAQILLGLAAVAAAVPLVIDPPAFLSYALEGTFAAAVIALVAAGLGRERDLGVQLGLISISVPLLVHTINVIGAKFLWPEGAFDTPGVTVARAGVMALCVGALVSPYVFAPRPFSRSVTRPGPVLVAMAIAAIGAIAARTWYPQIAKAATLAIGVSLDQGAADPRLAIYLLAIATLTWTLVSCAIASAASRRAIGTGIALVVLGGYAFKWPLHYLLPLLGMSLIAEAARTVREDELSALPLSCDTPPIADAAWSSYIGAVTTALKRTLGGVHSLTTRGEANLTSSVIVGDKDGIAVRTRIERIDGSVIALDVVLGREIDEVRGATLCLWAIPPRALGINPAGPPAAPLFRSGDASFDQRFKSRGSALAFTQLLDEGLRARMIATLDGWLAYWDKEGMRYRVYPGRGAPLDHPMPLSDLALGRAATPERLVAVVELLAEIAARVLPAVTPAEPTELEVDA